jgi:hypothetical protein
VACLRQQAVSTIPSRCQAQQDVASTIRAGLAGTMWCGAWCWKAARRDRTRFTRQSPQVRTFTPTSSRVAETYVSATSAYSPLPLVVQWR